MAAFTEPRVESLLSDEAIEVGRFVRAGSDNKHGALAEAGERPIGISMNAVTASGQVLEVAKPGGGAKVKLGGTVSAGHFLKPTTGGKAIKGAADGDLCFAQAQEAGVDGDIIAVEVIPMHVAAAES